jgi:hypothetical protein
MPRPWGHPSKAREYEPELEAEAQAFREDPPRFPPARRGERECDAAARQRNWQARYDAAILTIRGCLASDMIHCACDTLEYAYWLWLRRPGRHQ